MKALTKKLWSAVVAFAMAFTFIFSGMSGIFTAISAKAEATALETTDLFCIGFGANDLHTEPEHFKKNLAGMIDGYFEKNPNGNVLLYSCLLPNNQATGWRANQPLFEQALIDLANDYDRVGVAKVSKVFLWVEGQGKKTRDFLANSVNHPNDFGVRIYAQTLLKTILGDEFV